MELVYLEDMLSDEAIEEICQSGSNDEAVKKWTNEYLHEMGRLNICPFACKKMLEGYDFGPVEDKMEWMERAIWCAAWNVFESSNQMEMTQ